MKFHFAAALISAVLISAVLIPGATAVAGVTLGRAAPFAVLAGAGITNSGDSTVVGDIGSHPLGTMTGMASVDHTGEVHAADAVADEAKQDLVLAYEDARDREDATEVGALVGLTLPAGVYHDDAVMTLTGTLTLDGQNDTNAVFIFQSGSSLILGAGSEVLLVNGAQACNVFWQVTSSATLDTGAHLEGTIMALESITLGTGASIHGAALAMTGSVTMLGNEIVLDTCDIPTSTTSNSPSSSTTESTTTSSPSTTTTTTSTTTSPPTTTTSPPTTTTSPPTTTTSPPTTTTSPPQTTTSSPTQSETQTPSPSLTTSDSQTPPPPSGTTPPPGTTTSQGPTTEVPFFPSTWIAVLASVGALGGAFLMVRRRL